MTVSFLIVAQCRDPEGSIPERRAQLKYPLSLVSIAESYFTCLSIADDDHPRSSVSGSRIPNLPLRPAAS